MTHKTLQSIRLRKAVVKNLVDLLHAVIIALIIGLPFAGYFAFVMEA